MARHDKRPEREQPRRRSALVALFAFFPGLISIGVLAPGMVKVLAEDEVAHASEMRITRRLSRYDHQPLLLPRDFSVGFVPELLDLEHLFGRTEYMRDPRIIERSRLPSFPRTFGDTIVLDDVDQRIREIVFKDPVLLAQAAPPKWPPPATDVAALPGPGTVNPGGPRYDDYFGPQIEPEPPVVPEPSTGLLLGMGLVGLGFRRRQRQRARCATA